MEFEDLLRDFTSAVEAGEGASLAALFTEDGVYRDGFYGDFRGRDAIARMLEEHFWGHAQGFRWEMCDPVCDGRLGYARYVFSYTSKLEEAEGARVVFEGMCRFVLRDGRIEEYSESFDRGVALIQLGFAEARIARHVGRVAKSLRERLAGSAHLRSQVPDQAP